MNDNAATASKPTFQFDYTNHEGKKTRPRVVVDTCAFWYGSTTWHPEPQMLMKAFDVDKGDAGAWRDYAVEAIVWPAEVLFGLRMAWNAVNVLGAPATAHGDGESCERCKGIGEALDAIDEVNLQMGGEQFLAFQPAEPELENLMPFAPMQDEAEINLMLEWWGPYLKTPKLDEALEQDMIEAGEVEELAFDAFEQGWQAGRRNGVPNNGR